MNSKERILISLNHEEPDRVPLDLWFTSEIEDMLAQEFGGLRGDELRVALGHDLLMTASPNIGASYEIPDTAEEYVCEWGVGWKWVTNANGGRYTEAVAHPLEGAKDLSNYTLPDPLGPSMQVIYDETNELVQRYGGTHAIFGSLYQTIFEAAWLLRGLENLLVDMAINKDFAHELFDRLLVYLNGIRAHQEVLALGKGKTTKRPQALTTHLNTAPEGAS